jgi:hypothetical protein
MRWQRVNRAKEFVTLRGTFAEGAMCLAEKESLVRQCNLRAPLLILVVAD